jgi:hypothetical protein
MFCVRRGRLARVPVVSASVALQHGNLDEAHVLQHREDMMLICMARHRHLASRYGGSTCYLVLFFVPLALFSHLFWWRGPFTGVLGAGEERNHYTGRNLLGEGERRESNTDDIPPAGATRLETGRKRRKDMATRDVAQAQHLRQEPSRKDHNHNRGRVFRGCLPAGKG